MVMGTLFMEWAVACALLTAFLVPALQKAPEAWARWYPPEVLAHRGAPPPKPGGRALLRRALLLVAVAAATAVVLVVCNNAFDAFYGFCYAWLLWLGTDVYAVLVLGCGWFAHSAAVRLPGTETLDAAYGDVLHYFKLGAKTAVFGILPSALVAGLCPLGANVMNAIL